MRILFVPVSGSAGSGEVQRCRLLAQALLQRWPECEAHFLLAPGIDPAPFPGIELPASPTKSPREVAAAIAQLQPALVVFDGNARVASLAAAHAAGARTLLLSSRPSARGRGFRWRRMAQLDAHWLIGADLLGAPGCRECLARWRYPRVGVRRFATLFAPPAELAPLRARFGLADAPYAVVCTGGGEHAGAAARFGAVAAALARDGLATLAVAMPAPPPAIATPALPNAELMALLAGARVAVLAGGSLLVQALALGTPVVASPLQAEQAARVRWLARAGAVQVADAGEPAAIAEAARKLAGDDAARERLRSSARALGLRNDLDAATAALAALAGLG
ncbi:hypothetical protein FNZ56_10350 [Pseudoluteimonas lycopersici]|uniref:Glycosyltransferase family 1 protein n=1 Tax=Pseudoluteimonas lycopersici TaxID=1324796 RepID=A0A516V6W3_9GAMM|nr:hypothetical protein [Lysobacter lycopersici]QDQ74255.1 hypothetical protein FNZ56_10350 [Lysobacter lycopersici]